MKLLIVGFATMDIYPDTKIPGGAAGGMSLNASTLASVKPWLLAPLGRDENGITYRGILQSSGVNINLCQVSEHNPTCIIHDPFGTSHERIWSDNGAALIFETLDPKTLPLSGFDGIIFANTSPLLVTKLTPHLPTSTLLFYVPGPHIVKDSTNLNKQTLAKSEIVFANAEEEPIVTEAEPVKLGAKVFVSTHGADGVKITTKSGTAHYPVPKIKNPVDATGAGDCFTLGFIVEYLKSKSLDQSVKAGQKLAEKIIKKQGVLLKDYV